MLLISGPLQSLMRHSGGREQEAAEHLEAVHVLQLIVVTLTRTKTSVAVQPNRVLYALCYASERSAVLNEHNGLQHLAGLELRSLAATQLLHSLTFASHPHRHRSLHATTFSTVLLRPTVSKTNLMASICFEY